MNGSDTEIIINDSEPEITLKLDSVELERTMRLSDKELQKAVRQVHRAQDEEKSSGNTTSIFTLGKTSALSMIFDKKRDVDDDLARTAEHTGAEEKNIEDLKENDVLLHSVEESFEIIGKIGEGGQGVVSTAADRSLGRIVALKSLHSKLNKKHESREHFIAEAKITAQLDYPGIVPVYSLNGDKSGGLHLAMKFINGENLADYLERIRKQYKSEGINKFNENHSLRKRIEIFLRTCDAVSYAHSRNVMHCDLKPENIMLGQHNDSYIMDWGIARLIDDPAYDPDTWTRPNTISGTPRYLAPEAIDGVYTDERIDIYALGLILFECVYLKSAYNGKDTREVIAKIKNSQTAKFTHAFNVPVNKDLCAIIRKAIAHDRDERYQTVDALAEDLRSYLANEETVARPDNIFTKIYRFGQRHIKMLLIFGLLWLLIAGAAVSYSVYRENQRANFILQRDVALSEAYSKALYVSGLIELQMHHVASSLKNLSAYISFLLSHNVQSTADHSRFFWYPDEQKKSERASDIVFSALCNKYITVNRMSFNHPGGKYDKKMYDNMLRMQTLQGLLRDEFLRGDIFRDKSSLDRMSEKEAEKYFYQNGSPKLWIHCGFEDGLYFCMPGYLDQPEKYDPRTRQWYIAAAKKTPFDDVIWSKPYVDAVSKRLTITASLPIFVNKKLQGVIAVDNMLRYIARFMKNKGNTDAFLLEKAIIDGEGRIILGTREDYSVKDEMNDGEEKIYQSGNFFDDEQTFKIIRQRKNGMLTIRTANDRNIVYLFYRINMHDWHYVEKIDLDMLLASIEEKQKNKTEKH